MVIHIEDVNDNLAIFDNDNLNITLHEHMDNGQEVIKLNATDLDKVSTILDILFFNFFY